MIGWVSALVLIAGFARWYRKRLRTRRQRATDLDQAVHLVDDLLRQVRSGATLSSGFQAAARRCPVDGLATFEQSMAAGRRFVSSLDHVVGERPGTPLALVAVAVGVVAGNGSAAGAALERLAETLRAKRSAAAERHAQSAQATLSAAVLGVLPILGAIGLIVGSGSSRAVYASSLGGWCVAAMTALIVSGQAWIDLLIWGRGA